jgi:hypothetical protein
VVFRDPRPIPSPYISHLWKVRPKVTGHGHGTDLIDRLVDSNKITTAFTWLGSGTGITVNLDTDQKTSLFTASLGDQVKAIATSEGVSISSNTNILIAVGDNASLPERTENGSIEMVKPPDAAVLLGHELSHATHILDGTYDASPGAKPPTGEHYFSENGVNYVEHEEQEEFRTVGLGYNRKGDITENQLRKELGLSPRAAYGGRDKWQIRQ